MMQARLSEIGHELGINFAYGGKTGNTRDSHRVVQLAKTKGEKTQTRVMEKLFNAYFELNEDITDHAVLTKAAVGGGLEEKEVKEWLESDKGGPEVDREVAAAQRRFISGKFADFITTNYQFLFTDSCYLRCSPLHLQQYVRSRWCRGTCHFPANLQRDQEA